MHFLLIPRVCPSLAILYRYSNPQFFYQEWYRLEVERQVSVCDRVPHFTHFYGILFQCENCSMRSSATLLWCGCDGWCGLLIVNVQRRVAGCRWLKVLPMITSICLFFQEKSVREKRQKKEERKRRKAAAKAGGAARAGGEQAEENVRVPRPARKSISDWRGKFTMSGFGNERGGSGRSSAGDVSSLVGNEKLVVQQREALGDKFYKQVGKYHSQRLWAFFCFVLHGVVFLCSGQLDSNMPNR